MTSYAPQNHKLRDKARTIFPTHLKKYSGYITVIRIDQFKVTISSIDHSRYHNTIEDAFDDLRNMSMNNNIQIQNIIYGPYEDDKGTYYEVDVDNGLVQFSEEDLNLIQEKVITFDGIIPKFTIEKTRLSLVREIMGDKIFTYRDGRRYNLRRCNLVERQITNTESEYY